MVAGTGGENVEVLGGVAAAAAAAWASAGSCVLLVCPSRGVEGTSGNEPVLPPPAATVDAEEAEDGSGDPGTLRCWCWLWCCWCSRACAAGGELADGVW